jgi:hypothetical protein
MVHYALPGQTSNDAAKRLPLNIPHSGENAMPTTGTAELYVRTIGNPFKRGMISMNPGDYKSDGTWSASSPQGDGLFQETHGTFKVRNNIATLTGPNGQVIVLKEYDPSPGHAGDAILQPVGDDPTPIQLMWRDSPWV